MEARPIRILEYDKVKATIQSFVACSLGRDKLEAMQPFSTPEEAERELATVDECLQFVFRHGTLPYGGITNIRPFLRKAAIGGILRGEDLNAIAEVISGGRRIRQAVEGVLETLPLPHLQEAVNQLFDARQTEQEIRQAVDVDGSILDSASPELRRLRTNRRQAESKVRQVLEGMLRTHQKYLQDPVIAMRGNSLCLPVRVEFKNLVSGIIHDYSASGATVFVEPQAAVEANQKVREYLFEEEREIERILLRISSVVGTVATELEQNCDILADLDAWFAKAQYAKSNYCERPRLRTDKVWELKRARHPLIDRDQAVPLDISLGKPHGMVVITGPNTGGKTVTLKTVGLLTLLAMSGCFIPTERPSDIGWCDEIFVDIGDEQSIEQSLSTFSSHMRNIVHMLEHVTGDSLVLLDELGAGTDPTEGAALAIAILDHLNAWGCRIVATTHYSELKGYAFSEPNAINASVEFDVETLRPTYRLLIGIPGRSNAIAIATRLGLSERIASNARSLLQTNDIRVEDIIAKMEQARKDAELAEEEARAEREEAARLKSQWEHKWESLQSETDRLRQQAEAEAREVIERAQSEATRVIQEIRRHKQTAVKDHELVNLRKSLEDALPVTNTRKRGKSKAQDVEVGAVVRVLSLGQKGEVVEKSSDGKELTVQLGLLKMKVNSTDVELLQQAPAPQQQVSTRRGMPKTISLQLDVRGETVDDAVVQIDKYLDDAVVNSIPRVTIIHGLGTGALRDGVRRYLGRHPHVKSWVPGGMGEGGDGATVVQLNK